MTPIDDPVHVREQYAREDNLRARQALWEGAEGTSPKDVLWRTLVEWQPKRLLEVGGGQGELAERMQNELGAEVTFVDQSPRMVELAQGRGIERAQVGDVQELPFADGEFDTVVAAWMLYHVPDIDRALAEIARVLTKGGALIAVTNSFDHISELRELVEYDGNFDGTFSRENGEELLRPHFSSIERYDADVTVRITEREKLIAYRDSVSMATRPVPEDLELPFVVHGRSTIFFATT